MHDISKLNLSNWLVPVRLTYCYHVVPLQSIDDKMIFVNGFICISSNFFEKNETALIHNLFAEFTDPAIKNKTHKVFVLNK